MLNNAHLTLARWKTKNGSGRQDQARQLKVCMFFLENIYLDVPIEKVKKCPYFYWSYFVH